MTRADEEDSINPPHNKPPLDTRSADEKNQAIKAANRAWFEAAGSLEAFYAIYPYERPPARGRRKAAPNDGKDTRERDGGRGGR